MAFGSCGYPFMAVDKAMDAYSQKAPGLRHRFKDHDPLRAGDYDDPDPESDKWRIVYRLYHIAVDWWWTDLSKEERQHWKEETKKRVYPQPINNYFWEIVEWIARSPLEVYEMLPWLCEPLPQGWVEHLSSNPRAGVVDEME